MERRSLPVVDGAAPESQTTVHWVVGSRCNLACDDCRRTTLPATTRPVGQGVVVVTGGEPMLEPAFLATLRATHEPWEIETNGTLLYVPANAARLRAAGTRRVRLFLPGFDEVSTDARAHVPGVAALQRRAAENVLDAGLDLAFVVPVSEANASRMTEWLGWIERLAERRPRTTPIEVFLAWQVAPDARPSAALEIALGRFALASIARSMLARFDGPLAPAPCAFRRPEAFASLFAPLGSPRTKPPACASCPLDARCTGPAPGAVAVPVARGDREEISWEAALSTLEHAPAQIADWVRNGQIGRWGRENFVSIGGELDLSTGRAVLAALIRPIFHCNEDCTFCWVDLAQPMTPDAAVSQAIAQCGLEGMEVLSITGGEPSLDPRVTRFVREARALGARQITLQTNAVRLARRDVAEALATAGVTRAFVSLHGHDAATSEAVTRRTGTFERTLEGARNLLDLGVSVGIGVVFTHENREGAARIVQLVADRLPGADLTLSVASPVNDRLDARTIAPRYSDLADTLREAAHAAHALGLKYSGLYGQCGLPPCILDADPVCFPELGRPLPDWSAAQDFVHAPQCEGCRLRAKCPGVRKRYAAVHGTDELHPVE